MPFARFGAFRDFLIFPSFPARGLLHGLVICSLERVKHAQIAGPLRNGEPAAGGGVVVASLGRGRNKNAPRKIDSPGY